MRLIDGKSLAGKILDRLRRTISRMPRKPGLAIILVGRDQGSRVYVRRKEEAARTIGIHFVKYAFPAGVREARLLRLIERLNRDPKIHGMIVQMPLPKHLNEDRLILAMDPRKDADGFHFENLKRYLRGERGALIPGVIRGILLLIDQTKVKLRGKRAVILANSQIFADPLMVALQRKGMAVETFLPPFTGFRSATNRADLLVSAVGRPHVIRGSIVKRGVILVDVGFSRKGKKVVGDVDQRSVERKAGWLTPVPGGVGPMTVAMLLERTVELARASRKAIKP